MKFSVKKVIAVAGIALIFAIVLAANIVAGIFSSVITNALYDYSSLTTSETMKQALRVSADLAEEIASEGIVMLKNDRDVLPLADSERKINVFGWGATGYVSSDSSKNYSGGFVMSGSGSGNADVTKAKRLLNALEEEGFEYNPKLIEISKEFQNNRSTGSPLNTHPNMFYRLYEAPVTDYTPTVMADAKNYSDIAVIVISRLGGEGIDLPTVQYKASKANAGTNDYVIDGNKTYLQLSDEEEALIKQVKASNFGKVILLLNTCNIMELGFIEDSAYGIDAVLSVGALGTSGALAIPRILKGKKDTLKLDSEGNAIQDENGTYLKEEIDFSPSGKTVDTWPYNMKDDPSYVNSGQNYYLGHDDAAKVATSVGGHTGVTAYTSGGNNYIDYNEDIYIGYRYYETAAAEKYINYDDVVQFPFGYGLSYTQFEWAIESISPAPGTTFTKNAPITVKINVKNTGKVPGQDVVQIYVTAPYRGGIEKPHVVMTAFAKTALLQPADKTLGENEINDQTLTLTFDPYDFASYDCYDSNRNSFMGYELEKGEYFIKLQTDSHHIKTDCKTAAGVSGVTEGVFKYNLPNDVLFNEDITVNEEGGGTKTLIAAQNYFTGDAANKYYFGIPIDGRSGISTAGANGGSASGVNSGNGISMISRSDFAGTFPSKKAAARARLYTLPAGAGERPGYDAPVAGNRPDTGKDYSIRLTKKDGDKTVATEAMMTLGKNYDDPLWEKFLDQLTEDEMWNLVYRGGYHTWEASSVGKPFMHDLDGPSGLNSGNQSISNKSGWTAFPVETVIAQAWSRMLAYSMGLAVGNEAKASGVGGWYAPACNLHRSPFGGRNFEYFSEDPVLSGLLSADVTEGALTNGLYCYVKHFVVNETETNRGGLRTWLSEQALRELYLKPFEIAIKKGHASGIMTSFNFLGAVWTGGSKPLCTYILRDEWGFRGTVCTDYFSGSGDWMNAAQGLRAGNDLWIGQDSQPTFQDRTEDSGVILLRNAAHNLLFSYANAYWYSNTHEADDARFAADTSAINATEKPIAWWWLWGVLPIDLLAISGIGVLIYFTFIRDIMKKKKFGNNV